MIWERSGGAYYATIVEADGEIAFHLVVESNGARWSWIVWRPGDTNEEVRHGVGASVHEAMRAAEQAIG